MTIRDATPADLLALEPLWRAFEEEIPEPPWVDVDIDDELRDVAETLDRGTVAVIAENEIGEPVGFAIARRWGRRLGRITDLYVIPGARGHGLARRLTARIVERLRTLGLDTVQLEVVATNDSARAIYAGWGFKLQELTLATPLDELGRRLTGQQNPRIGLD
jgi:ribosomal protein S18 acetylase RimI-like enzyme